MADGMFKSCVIRRSLSSVMFFSGLVSRPLLKETPAPRSAATQVPGTSETKVLYLIFLRLIYAYRLPLLQVLVLYKLMMLTTAMLAL